MSPPQPNTGPISVGELLTDPAGVPRARAMLQRAEWAARAFARYDKGAVDAIVRAAAEAAAAKARYYAEWAVRETGFGVAEHKVLKNIACSTGIVDFYADHDYVTPRIDAAAKIVEVPRPAGVVLALTPSTNPVATVFFKCLLALMTRSVVVVSPHPLARECCADAARTLAAAAVRAGAPDGVIQVVDEPSVPLIDALMTDERTSVIVATGGSPGTSRSAVTDSGDPGHPRAAELRVYLLVRDLQSQFAAYLGTAVAANEAERAAPGVTLVDVSMIGAAGRIYLGGPTADVRRAQREITGVLSAVTGRENYAWPRTPLPAAPTPTWPPATTCRLAGR